MALDSVVSSPARLIVKSKMALVESANAATTQSAGSCK